MTRTGRRTDRRGYSALGIASLVFSVSSGAVDPEETEVVEGPAQSTPLGAGRMPWPGWVHLIALYALRNRSVRSLIEALHPDPSSVDVGKFH